jgi:hypothetical protein
MLFSQPDAIVPGIRMSILTKFSVISFQLSVTARLSHLHDPLAVFVRDSQAWRTED